ncbi:MAG: winged helix-turn-helix domain-containing protein [Candidatus Woesearchaeota archaeon]
MSRRTKLDVINDILVVIQDKGGSIRPTPLMYKANLSSKLLASYLKELQSKGLVDIEESSHRTVRLTGTGYDFIRKFRLMREFQDAFGL